MWVLLGESLQEVLWEVSPLLVRGQLQAPQPQLLVLGLVFHLAAETLHWGNICSNPSFIILRVESWGAAQHSGNHFPNVWRYRRCLLRQRVKAGRWPYGRTPNVPCWCLRDGWST